MKLSHKPFIFTITILFTILTILSDVAYAGRGGGRGGGGRSGGGARTSSVQRSSGSRSAGSRSSTSRGGGASPRVSSGTSTQNRGNFSNSSSRQSSRQTNQGQRQTNRNDAQNNRQANQGERQTNRSNNQANRQDNRGDRTANRQDNINNRQDNRTDRTTNRQDNRTDRATNRQDNITNRQNNRQDFVNDNWYGGGWYGGGYYVPPGWGAWAGLAGLTTGLIIGASVNTPPPYYDTVYIGSSSYIYSDGVYMQPVDGSYVVVSPPTGVVVNYLPDGCNVIQDGDFQYYDCAGIYYETVYQNGVTVYRVMEY